MENPAVFTPLNEHLILFQKHKKVHWALPYPFLEHSFTSFNLSYIVISVPQDSIEIWMIILQLLSRQIPLRWRIK